MELEVSALVLFLSLTFVFGVNAAGDKCEGFEDAANSSLVGTLMTIGDVTDVLAI